MNNTLQNAVTPEDEEFFATQFFSMNDKVCDDPEADEELQDYEGAYIWRGFQSNFRILSLKEIQESTLTLESFSGDRISLTSESPFDILDEYRNEDEKVLRIISYIRTQLNADFAQQLANRLEFLFQISHEEHPDEVAIIPESLSNFVALLQSETYLKYPDVMLSPSNNIRIQWRTAPNRHFAVEFLNSGDAQFVIFSPDPSHPERTIRLSGIASIDSLMEMVRPYGVLRWSSR
jgi:hypothetical protein